MPLNIQQIVAVERALNCAGLWPLHGVLRYLLGPDIHEFKRATGYAPRPSSRGRSSVAAPASTAVSPLAAVDASLGREPTMASSGSRPRAPIPQMRYSQRPIASLLPGLACTALFPSHETTPCRFAPAIAQPTTQRSEPK